MITIVIYLISLCKKLKWTQIIVWPLFLAKFPPKKCTFTCYIMVVHVHVHTCIMCIHVHVHCACTVQTTLVIILCMYNTIILGLCLHEI